jgi:subfamily B ATP-binding cassette protein MsbA
MRSFLKLVRFYHDLLGSRLFVLLGLSTAAAALEIIGVGFFMPLLSGTGASNPVNAAFRRVFSWLGIGFTITNILAAFLIMISLRTVVLLFESEYTGRLTSKMLVDLRKMLGRRIFGMNYLGYLGKSSGFLNNALITEAQNVAFAFRMFASLIVSSLLAFAYSLMPLALNPVLVLILALSFGALYPGLKAINRRTKAYSVKTTGHSGELQKMFIQALGNFKYLKATGAHEKVTRHVENESAKLGALQRRLAMLQGISDHGVEPVVAALVAGVIYYFIVLRHGNIAEYVFLVFMLMTTMRKILGMQQNLRKLLASWGSIGAIDALQSELEAEREARPADARFDPGYFDFPIVLRNVGFGYGTRPGVLKDVNLELAPNTTVAFVGESGGGKSTLVNLIAGLHQPSEGSLSLGAVSYDRIDKERFRASVGYITQECVVFNDTIRNNISLWDEPSAASEARLRDAVAKARLDEFVAGLPMGLDSMLGEGGVNISGGQRQRISIARELYKDPRIIVLDEATSALDSQTERDIQRNIDEFKGKKTVILIAHRLSTVRKCDRIYVLKQGRIVESGDYAGLIGQNGEFARMVALQEERVETAWS